MHKIFGSTANRPDGAPSWTWRSIKLSTVLGIILFITLLHHSGEAFGATPPGTNSAILAWDRSPSTNVTGYRLHYGVASGNYTNSVAMTGNLTTNTVRGLVSGVRYFFAVTAHTAGGLQSDPSNEISFVPNPSAFPISVTTTNRTSLTVRGLAGQRHSILATQNFTNWTVIATVTLGASGSVNFTDPNAASYSRRFYRTQPAL